MRGEDIRKARKESGLTQEALAEATGMKQEYISQLENSDVLNVKIDTLIRIANALGKQLTITLGEPESIAATVIEAAA